jgi:hypothetical protein
MNPSSLWRPLRVPIFRNLLAADVISDIGAFMQSTGAAWLMVSLNAGPTYVALTQTAASLPFFLLALPVTTASDNNALVVVGGTSGRALRSDCQCCRTL